MVQKVDGNITEADNYLCFVIVQIKKKTHCRLFKKTKWSPSLLYQINICDIITRRLLRSTICTINVCRIWGVKIKFYLATGIHTCIDTYIQSYIYVWFGPRLKSNFPKFQVDFSTFKVDFFRRLKSIFPRLK